MGKNEGYIKLYRQIQDNWVWEEKPFSKGQAWIDLLLMANHRDVETLYKGKSMFFQRGTVNLSKSALAKKWGWSRPRVDRFLDALEKTEMISVNPTANGTTNGTTIIIKKWDVYQAFGAFDTWQKNVTNDVTKNDAVSTIEKQGFSQDYSTKNVTKDITKTVQRPCTNNNDKNDNNNITCASDDAQGVISENKEPISDKPTKKQEMDEVDEFFETIWKMYPRKKGKARVKRAQRKKLYEICLEEMTRVIERYCQYIAGKDEQFIQYGSTFFNGGYVDYLDSNYEPIPDISSQASAKQPKPAGLRFDP